MYNFHDVIKFRTYFHVRSLLTIPFPLSSYSLHEPPRLRIHAWIYPCTRAYISRQVYIYTRLVFPLKISPTYAALMKSVRKSVSLSLSPYRSRLGGLSACRGAMSFLSFVLRRARAEPEASNSRFTYMHVWPYITGARARGACAGILCGAIYGCMMRLMRPVRYARLPSTIIAAPMCLGKLLNIYIPGQWGFFFRKLTSFLGLFL